MASLYDDPALTQAQTTATSAQSDYLNSATRDVTLPDMLRNALQSKFNNTQLQQERDAAQANYFNTTTSAPLSVLPENNNGIIFNPAQQADLINQRKTAALTPLLHLNDLLAMQQGGLKETIDAISRAGQAETLGKKAKADTAQSVYENLLNLITKKQSEKEFNMNYDLKLKELAKGSAADQKKAVYDNLVRDIKGKVTLKSLLTKYGGDFTPDEIYNAYNSASPWGAAKEGSDTLSQLGITPGKTAQKNDRQQAGLSSVKQINNVSESIKKKTGSIQAQAVSSRLSMPGILGKGGLKGDDAALADLESKYFALIQTALTYIQGSRPSDYDVKSYQQKLGPSIINSPEVNEDRINNLYKLLGGKGENIPTKDTRPPLSSFDK